MNARGIACICGCVVLLFLAGCTGLGDATSESGLLEDATYDWHTEADVSIDIETDEYTAIYRLENRSSLNIYQRTRYGTDRPIGIRAVQFRYTNGTVVNASELEISESRTQVRLIVPEENGSVAFTASKRPKQFSLPVFVDGSYEVTLPENHRVDNFVLATVRPRGYETTMVDDRVRIHWDDVTTRVVRVNYYLGRDLYLLAGLLGVVTVAGAIGMGYVYRQIQHLQRQREELGLDLDVDDDEFDQKPPPGMR